MAASLEKVKAASSRGAGLSAVQKNLSNLSAAIKGFTLPDGFGEQMNSFTAAVEPLANLNAKGLATFTRSLSKIPDITKALDAATLSQFAAAMQQVAVAVTPLASQMEKISNGFGAMPVKLQRFIKGLNSTGTAAANNAKKVNTFGFSIGSINAKLNLSALYYGLRRVSDVLGGFINQSNSYVENLNLFTVAMGEYADEAFSFAMKAQDLLGIDASQFIRFEGMFQQIGTGFGIASDKAYILSKNLTQIGYDISSLYNIDIEDAMNKLQSGIAGELEPLRRLGYALDEATLKQVALDEGITKNIRSMTQAEKAQLRYIAIFKQSSNALGDMARTIESPANQIRVMEQQFNLLARAIGNIFVPILNKVLPYVIALAKALRSVADAISSFFGFKLPTFDYSNLGGLSSGADDASSALDTAADSAKKLKDETLGLDELNIVDPNSGSSGKTNTGGGGLDFGIEDYQYDFLDGLTEKSDQLVPKMQKLLKLIAGVALVVGGFKLGVGFLTFMSMFGPAGAMTMGVAALHEGVSGLSAAIGTVSTGAWVALGGALAVALGMGFVYATDSNVRDMVSSSLNNLKNSFKNAISEITDKILPPMNKAFGALKDAISPVVEFVRTVFTDAWTEIVVPVLEYLANTVIPNLTECFMGLWDNALEPLATFVISVVSPIFAALGYILESLWKNVVLPLIDVVGTALGESFESLCDILTLVVFPAIGSVIDVLQFLWTKVLQPVATYLVTQFKPIFDTVFHAIGGLISAFSTILKGLIEFITGVFTGDWRKAWEGLANIFKGVWNGMVSVVEAAINLIITGINGIIGMLNHLRVDVPDWVQKKTGIGPSFGFNITPFDSVSIPRLATGGIVDSGQLFMARENGIPEMVGSIGNKAAVANNGQITTAIATAVYDAITAAQGSQSPEDININNIVELDGQVLYKSNQKVSRRMGYQLCGNPNF